MTFEVRAGECVVLDGPSGAGKSSILKMIFGNYRADAGSIWCATAANGWTSPAPRRGACCTCARSTIGYVSQFLRTIPRVGALDIVAAAARDNGVEPAKAKARAAELLDRLNIPERSGSCRPSTFSGGEQQRINIARGFAATHPILLLDEPTASLDGAIARPSSTSSASASAPARRCSASSTTRMSSSRSATAAST